VDGIGVEFESGRCVAGDVIEDSLLGAFSEEQEQIQGLGFGNLLKTK
jgi:hypothetical protein